ncbi:MAG: glycine cleavage system protein GcvH [Candidatus Hydrogenedentes bacterium]|nr:glycine cleavage system protein GcvH [Candidatus Hydrogenedentota bacterium]
MYPNDIKYTKDHEWIRDEGGVCVVGITAHAASQLGDVTYVELPEIGQDVKKGAAVASVESVKAASDIYSPVRGRIAEVNDDLLGKPELVNQSPYDQGWFFKLDDVDTADLRHLMDAAKYEAFVAEHAE